MEHDAGRPKGAQTLGELGAIIQARLGPHTRLPFKVLADIEGHPMLWHVIERTKAAVAEVIVATPDQEIGDYVATCGVQSFIGSEEDVLDRYYQAAKEHHLDHIVRITADNS